MITFLAGTALASLQNQAKEKIEQAIRLLGGRAKLESIRQLTVTTTGHDYLVEQSERPTGPYVTTYSRGTRTYDFDTLTETSEQTVAGLVYGSNEIKRTLTIDRGIGRASSPMENYTSFRRMALGPERALLLAASASDLTLGKDIVFNGVLHSVLEFKWGLVRTRLFLKKASGAPSGIETTSPLPFPWSVWGDVTMATRWGNWDVLPSGIMEPTQFSTEINGYQASDETILSTKVTLGDGKALLTPANPIPPDNSRDLIARYKPVRVADGIVQYQGPFNTFVVEQPDGLVVIEPVFTPSFASAFLDLLAKDHPGKRVKAVVATDDAWPHCGGIRTFVARGAEVVLLDLNRPLIQRFCDSNHRSNPDELSLKPAKPKYRLVSKPTTIGIGPNQIVLYPIAGQGSERMMMAYFPHQRLLYGSDLLQKQGNQFFFPAYPKELTEAVSRENLVVETVFAEHLGPTPWKVVTDFVARTIVGGS